MDTFSLYWKHDKQLDLPALLSIITLGDNRLVTFTLGEADELFTCEPSIMMVLQRAWKEGLFKEVQQLGVFGMQFLHISALKCCHRNPLACGGRTLPPAK